MVLYGVGWRRSLAFLVGYAMNTQLICETQPACRCIRGDDVYSCDCVASPGVDAVCVHCGEPMVVIDMDTGDVMKNGVVTTCH